MSENDTADTTEANESGQSGDQNTESRDPKVDSAFAAMRRAEKAKEEAEAKAKALEEENKRLKESPSAPVTREDLYKMNEKQALETLAASESEMDKEIVENKDAILDYYKARNGRDSKDGIIKDLRTAYAAWRFENPKQDSSAKDAVRELQGGVQKGKGTPQGIVDTKIDDSKFTLPKGPQDWYPTPKKET